jgi:hypothetical protein
LSGSRDRPTGNRNRRQAWSDHPIELVDQLAVAWSVSFLEIVSDSYISFLFLEIVSDSIYSVFSLNECCFFAVAMRRH